MEKDNHLFTKYDYIFEQVEVEHLTYDQATKHLAAFCKTPNEWRDYDLEETLAHYQCSFDNLPKVERDKHKQELADWYNAYGPNGSVAKEIQDHFGIRGNEKEVDSEEAGVEFQKWQEGQIAIYNPKSWLDRFISEESFKYRTGARQGKEARRDQDLDKD